MDRADDVIGVVLAVLADIDQNEFVATVNALLGLVYRGFANAAAGVIDNLEKSGRVIVGHDFLRDEMLPAL